MKHYLAFWSYARTDDQDEVLSRLRECVLKEVNAHSEEDHEIFRDRQDIETGDNWRERIREGLDGSDFLIPIITPKFMASEQCRFEVSTFISRERAEGFTDLILPIYWIEPDLLKYDSRRSTDAMATAIKQHHWADWTALRRLPTNSQCPQERVDTFALELLKKYRVAERRRLKSHRLSGTINWPNDKARAPHVAQIKGQIDGLPDGLTAWLVVIAGGKYHPQTKLTIDGSGHWNAKVHIGSRSSLNGSSYRVQLAVTTRETSRDIDRYLADAERMKDWHGIEAQQGYRVLQEITLIREDGAST